MFSPGPRDSQFNVSSVMCPRKRKYKTHFTSDYTKVYPRLTGVKNNDSLAQCTACNSDFSIARGGLNDCKRHVEVSFLFYSVS